MRALSLVLVFAVLTGCTVIKRARSYPAAAEITQVSWYQPQEVVPGRPTPLAAMDPARPTVSPEALEAVRAYAAARNTTGLVVLHHGKLALEWYPEGFDATSTTNSMSMAKTVMALLFGILQAEGRFPDVDRPVTDVFPELGRDPVRSLIRWRDLLEMTSGLRKDEAERLGSDLVKMHIGTDIESAVLEIPGVATPGFTFEYNNANTQLLGLAIERVSGKRLATVLSDRLWRPIGASDASLWLDRPEGTAHAYCCLFATARDWARLGEMMRQGGRVGTTQVVPRDFLVRMTLPSRHNPDYGWQLWRADDGPGSERAKERAEPLLDKAMFWLDGRGSQRVYVMPDDGFVVVRVGEEPEDWDDSFVANTLIRGVVKR